jgi:hypothetical protein
MSHNKVTPIASGNRSNRSIKHYDTSGKLFQIGADFPMNDKGWFNYVSCIWSDGHCFSFIRISAGLFAGCD